MRYGFIDPPRERRAIRRTGIVAALLLVAVWAVSLAVSAHVLLDVEAHAAPYAIPGTVCPAGGMR